MRLHCRLRSRAKIDEAELEKAKAHPAKTVIAAVGEYEVLSGEGAALSNLDLSGEQNRMIRELKAAGKTVVTVLINGRPMSVGEAAANSDALLGALERGKRGGKRLCRPCFRKGKSGGRLAATFPNTSGECPIYYNHPATGRPASETLYSARFADSPVEPLFPFGFGLCYTEFEYSDFEVKASDGKIETSVKVKNVGKERVRRLFSFMERPWGRKGQTGQGA